MNKFKLRAKELEILGELYGRLEQMEEYALEVYKETEELTQKTRWNRDLQKSELVWEDEEQTVPVMEKVWKNVRVSYDELTDEKRYEVDAIRKVKACLEKLA